MRAAGKEIVAAIVLMMSFTVMLTLAAEYEIPFDDPYNGDEADEYKKDGISVVPNGCQGTCGNVSIYYPFGIGPNKDCYLNEWFLINCTKSSDGVEKPFLSSFSDDKDSVREILSISYSSQSITMKESFSPLCQTTTTGSAVGSNNLSIISNTKLSESPFFYSSDGNTFMFYGCGSAVLTTPGQEFIQSGCKLSCSSNNTMAAPKFAYDCNGINCCDLSLHKDVNAYQINITTDSSPNACNYAFFLATSSSRDSLQRISNLVPEEKLVVPVVWSWTVTRDDFTSLPPRYSLDCYPYQSIYPPQLQGTYWNCRCKYPEEGNAYLPNGCQVTPGEWFEAKGVHMVPKGCRDKCGNVSIYYPFGVGNGNGGSKSCYLKEWFLINCTQSSDGSEKPYLSSISGGVEILGMSYESQTITIKESIPPSCQPAKGTNFSIIHNSKLSETPFFYSYGNNFMVFGCGYAFVTMPGQELKQHSYNLNCSKNTTPKTAYDCQGINCNHLIVDYDVNTYQVNFTHYSSINPACNYAFFLSDSSSLPPTLESLPSRQQEVVVVPVELRWTITQQDVPPSYSEYCVPSTYINPQLQRHNYLQCDCRGEGNVYLPDGCRWSLIDDGNKKLRPAIIGVSASFGFVFLIWACVFLYKAIKKRKMKKLREKFFKRNGGLLLQQQLLAKEGTVEKTKIFTASELDKATDHFNADRIVGRGGQGTVYKGMLIDGQIVAVKKSQAPISFELDDDEDRSLVSRFLLCMEENRLMEILDMEVIEQGKKEDVVAMAWLAQRCLNFNGKKRPTMKEVATELDTIKASHHSHLPSGAMESLEIESDYFIA
nr:wall-associated receptor kinase-like 1 [Ipomoea batatas]